MFIHDKYDRNGYLRGVIDQIKDEGLSDELFHMLCIELKFAHLDNPYFGGASVHVERDGRYYLLLFTSHDESTNYFPDGFGCHWTFDRFLEMIASPVHCYIGKDHRIHSTEDFTVADGILFMMGDEEFIVEGDLLARLKRYFKTDIYSVHELKSMFDNVDNSALEDMLRREPKDWDEIIRQIGSSTMLLAIDEDNMVEYEEEDWVFNSIKLNWFRIDREVTLKTSKEGIDHAVIVNFKNVVDHVFNFALPEIIISTPHGDAVMSRNLLIDKYELIEEYCNDKKLKQSYKCVFESEVKS